MTAERLNYLIEHCFRARRKENSRLFREDVARWLGVAPITLRRWQSGEVPVPRQVEIIFEILHFWPDVRAEAVDKVIQARDEGAKV